MPILLFLAAGSCSAIGGVTAVALVGQAKPLRRLASFQAAFDIVLLFLTYIYPFPELLQGLL